MCCGDVSATVTFPTDFNLTGKKQDLTLLEWEDSQRLAGFFTLSAGSVSCLDLPTAQARKLTRYPVPVALLGRLAVDKSLLGKGLGSILLADACQKVVSASAMLAVAGIVVDAKDEQSASFYQHFGFIPFPGQSERLLLPMRAFAR